MARLACIWHLQHVSTDDDEGSPVVTDAGSQTGERGDSGQLHRQLTDATSPWMPGCSGWSVNISRVARNADVSPGQPHVADPWTCMDATGMYILCLSHANKQLMLGGALRGTRELLAPFEAARWLQVAAVAHRLCPQESASCACASGLWTTQIDTMDLPKRQGVDILG